MTINLPCVPAMDARLRAVAFVVALVLIAMLTGCERYALDRQMEELCKKDGGVKVYEQIRLPVTEFDSDGAPFPKYWRSQPLIGTEGRLGPEYRYVHRNDILKKGDPVAGGVELSRRIEEVYRVSDDKLLGRSVSYIRLGGQWPLPGHPPSKRCPSDTATLITSIFIPGN